MHKPNNKNMFKLLPIVISFTLLIGGGTSVALSNNSVATSHTISQNTASVILKSNASQAQNNESDIFLSAIGN